MTADLTGPALDAAVARALGWDLVENYYNGEGMWSYKNGPHRLYCASSRLPAFSTDWTAAGLVVEHMRGLGWGIHLESGRVGFACQWFDEDGVPADEAIGSTAPEAICLAALAALGGADAGG